MPIPVINTNTSVLGFNQWQPWEYQPFATNAPDSWTCDNLPTGVTIDEVTGKISGPCEVAGVFVLGLIAHNEEGASAPLVLTIGIDEAPAALNNPGYEVIFETQSKAVTLVGGGDLTLYAAAGDDIVLFFHMKKVEAFLDVEEVDIALVIREFDNDRDLVISDDFKKLGSGTGAIYGIHAKVDPDEVAGVLGENEADKDTHFEGQAEIQMTYTNPDDFGPSTITISSRRFPIIIGSQYVGADE